MTIKCDYQHPTAEVPTRRTVSTRRMRDGWEQLHWDEGRCPVCRRDYASLVTRTTARRPAPLPPWSNAPVPRNPFKPQPLVPDDDPCTMCGRPSDHYLADGTPWCDTHYTETAQGRDQDMPL